MRPEWKEENSNSTATLNNNTSNNMNDDTNSTHDDNNNKKKMDSKFQHTRVALYIITAMVTIFYAGAFYGYGPMQLLLERDGAFASKCTLTIIDNEEVTDGNNGKANDDNDNEKETDIIICDAQTTSLVTVQFVALATQILSPLIGELSDRYGPTFLMGLMTISCLSGISLIMVASGSGIYEFLYPAFSLLGIVPISTNIAIIHVSMLFDNQLSRARVISSLNNMFDAGTATYLGLWAIGTKTSVSFLLLIGCYLTLAFILFCPCTYCWYLIGSNFQQQPETIIDNNNHHADFGHDHENSTMTIQVEDLPEKERIISNSCNIVESDESSNNTDTDTDIDKKREKKTYIKISLRSPWEQFKSRQFLLLCGFFSIHLGRDQFNVTTSRDFLGYLGDDEKGNRYQAIFSILAPLSIIGLPLVDYVLRIYGYYVALQCINMLAILHGVIQLSTKNLNVQIIGFVAFSFYRCFSYSVVFSFLASFIGQDVIGKMVGIMCLISAIFSLINIPLGRYTISHLDGNFFWANFFYTVAIVPCVWAAWLMGKGIKKEKMYQ